MIIVIASGKGGTGKTTIATSLALALDGAELNGTHDIQLVDCDVEEPNAALFLKPVLDRRQDVGILIPEVDKSKCTYCGICAQVCQFSAIAVLGRKVLVFPELCHGCGSCTLNCPENAIREVPKVMGVLESGHAGRIAFAHGIMNIGEPMAVPIIRQLKKWILPDHTVIVDAPPGASCPVVESIREADFLLLVTEPTPFGLHDLKAALHLARELQVPTAVVVNRADVGDDRVDRFCKENRIPILMRIPLDRRIAEAYSRGVPLIEALPEYRDRLQQLYRNILALLAQGATAPEEVTV
ncbi:MAG TPA: (4Fe-4S)-binding protein [Anaerolineae bacterium]|nr:(4Fe-4S)-binding protein [Anaerolineae bacterium]HIQ05294.1 (4Fe-4S)-binding protein [Anaerolineae bacterium]